MPLGLLLLTSLSILAACGAVLMLVPALRAALLSRTSALAAAGLAVLLSAASFLVSDSGASGTGTRTSRGFPKPYYFTWDSWEHPVTHAGVNWLYFVGNCVGWLSLVCAALVIRAAARQRFPRR